MLRFKKSYFAPDTFPSKENRRRDLECVEMDSELPFYAASVQVEDGNIRWLLLAGPSALARAHEGLPSKFKALAVYQLEPNFEDGVELRVGKVAEWDALVRVLADGQSPHDAYRIAGEVLIHTE